MTDEKFAELCRYEKNLFENGFVYYGGVDEAGRGPLAGPVVAACAIFNTAGPLPRANDSKKLSAKQRESMYDEIMECALGVGIGIVDNETIDQVNILQATYMAMRKAIDEAGENAGRKIEILLVDHVKIPGVAIPQQSITHGDALSVSIGAASIIAKVTRDRLMKKYGEEFPQYGFEKHMGYGTAAHYEAIRNFGICPIHRKSFLKKILGDES